jgi:hypothetical protein
VSISTFDFTFFLWDTICLFSLEKENFFFHLFLYRNLQLCAPTAFWIFFVAWSRERTQSGSGAGISWIYYLQFRNGLTQNLFALGLIDVCFFTFCMDKPQDQFEHCFQRSFKYLSWVKISTRE